MKNLMVKISLAFFFPMMSLAAAPEPLRVEVWSRGLSARMELKPRGAHYEMTVRLNGGQSTWKQVHRKDVSALITKISALEGLVAKDASVHEIKVSGCRSGWVRMRPQRPGDWRACLDQPAPGTSAANAHRANELAVMIADAFEKLVKASEAPIVLRPNGKSEEPEALIQFAETEDDRMARIESEVQDAERFANEQMQAERLRQRLIESERGRDPFLQKAANSTKVVKSAAKPAAPVAQQLKRLESLVHSVEKYVAETPSLLDSGLQKARKFAPSKKDLLQPVEKAKSQTAGPRAP